jgi:integrase
MPRPRKPPRLYLNPGENVWVIRDGPHTERTGFGEADRVEAEKKFSDYLARKFKPAIRESHLARIPVAEVLAVYGEEHVPGNRGASVESAGYNIATLLEWWGIRTLAEVNKKNCEAYAKWRRTAHYEDGKLVRRAVKPSSIRRELAVLNAAIIHWHKNHGPLESVPIVTLPPKPASRDRWLDRSEAALLLAAALGWYRITWTDVATRQRGERWARHRPGINRHLARFVLLGLYTGSRKAVILDLQWMANLVGGWVDLDRSVLYRKPPEMVETKKKKPPARLGRRIVTHLRRWHRLDDAARERAARKDAEKARGLFRHIVAWRGKHVSSVRTAWDLAVELSGLDGKVIRHTLRHTRATWLMQKGVDRWEASGHLGMSVQMLEDVYGHHHPDFQQEAAEV